MGYLINSRGEEGIVQWDLTLFPLHFGYVSGSIASRISQEKLAIFYSFRFYSDGMGNAKAHGRLGCLPLFSFQRFDMGSLK